MAEEASEGTRLASIPLSVGVWLLGTALVDSRPDFRLWPAQPRIMEEMHMMRTLRETMSSIMLGGGWQSSQVVEVLGA